MSASAVARVQQDAAKWLEFGGLLGASVRRIADLGATKAARRGQPVSA